MGLQRYHLTDSSVKPAGGGILENEKPRLESVEAGPIKIIGAGEGARTLDLKLGKLAL
jgi:hypothetical protein